jgi:hypothetical protein
LISALTKGFRMLRREFTGAALRTNLSANISSGDSSFSVTDAVGFPSGANPFAVVLDRGTSDEEKMLISSRSGTTFTIQTRGYDGTTARSHTSGAFVDHILDAATIQDMNTTTYDNEVLMWMGA